MSYLCRRNIAKTEKMKHFKLIFLALLLPLGAQAEDKFGTWAEIGIEKVLPHNWSVGMETELRSEERTRWSVGANIGYKPVKYLKLGASYNFLYRYRPENQREHYKDDVVSDDNWNGYNLRDAYWSPRHRLSVEATGTYKFWKWLRISVRERYQYTHRMQSTAADWKYRYSKLYNGSGDFQGYELKDGYPEQETDTIASEDNHILRSRLKLAVDKKGWKFGPFISVEFHNNLGDGMNLEKIRSAIGCEYKINKRHELSLSYILTANIKDEDDHSRLHQRLHAVSMGYNFKF